MWVVITRLILRNRIAILSILGIAIAINLYYANNIRMSYGFARMMPEDDSVAIVYHNFEKTFGQAGNAVVIVAQDPDFFTPTHLKNWSDYTDSLKGHRWYF
jgi:predicted RND superfamily exporter protein